jgi:hypothetical protein
MLARVVFIAAINAPETGSDRMQLQLKKAAVPAAASIAISGSGIIPEAWLSRAQVAFVIHSGSLALTPETADAKIKKRFAALSPEAFAFQIVGNLAALAVLALDPWFCAAIFR